MKVALHVIAGPEAGKKFEFTEADTFLVGRTKKAHLRFDQEADRLISRTHFLLDIRPPRCIIMDLGSRNGTFVNQRRVTQTVLKNGDEIQVGKTLIRVGILAPAQKAAPTTRGTVRAGTPSTPGRPRIKKVVDTNSNSDLGSTLSEARYYCSECSKDLTEPADSDGLAAALFNSQYICDACMARVQPDRDMPQGLIDYTLLTAVGRGGMGVVYKAVQNLTRRICAIKTIHPEMIRNEYASKVFEREIEVQSKVIHPNLVRVLDQGRLQGAPFFVTEYLAGGDIKTLVVDEFNGPIPPDLACKIAVQILRGLEALHEKGFIHRDLKPANYLLDRTYKDSHFQAKIADYGLAKSFENAGNSIFEYTREGIAAGSYVFIPPEQITNYKFVKPPVDVYAVGVSLYWMLSGRYSVDFPSPTQGGASAGRHPMQVILEDPPVPLLKRKPGLPASLAATVDKAVTKEYSKRFQTAAEFRKSLEITARREKWRI